MRIVFRIHWLKRDTKQRIYIEKFIDENPNIYKYGQSRFMEKFE